MTIRNAKLAVPTLKGITALLGGSASSQVITLMAAPILTRLYEPKHFGDYAVFFACLSILSVGITARYELAIPVATDTSQAINLAIAGFSITVLIAATILILNYTLHAIPSMGFQFPVILLAGCLLIAGALQTVSYLAVRMRLFGPLAATRMVTGIGTNGTQLAAPSFFAGSVGLVLGNLIGPALGASLLTSRVLAHLKGEEWRLSKMRILRTAWDYRRFPLFSFPSGIVNALSANVPALLFVKFFGAEVTGYYAIAARVTQAPIQLIGSAIGQVFMADAVEAKKSNGLHSLVEDTYRLLANISFILLIPFGILAPEIFQVIFGEQWKISGEYASYCIPWVFLVLSGSPLSTLPNILGYQRGELIFQTSLLLARVTAVVATSGFTSKVAVLVFAMISAICWAIYNLWLFVISGNGLSAFARIHYQALMTSLVLVLVSLLVKLTISYYPTLLPVSLMIPVVSALRSAVLLRLRVGN